jgi:hypothetical protein
MTTQCNSLRISDFERYHAQAIVHTLPPITLKELLCTFAVTFCLAPFSFVGFMVIPMIGVITVAFTAFISTMYLVSRRSWAVSLTAVGGTVVFWTILFNTIQGIKNQLEVALFFFTAMAIPVSVIFCILVSARTWMLRGGVEA